jgi:hypothetical protein
MMSQTLNILLGLDCDTIHKLVVGRIYTTCKLEVLPHQDTKL